MFFETAYLLQSATAIFMSTWATLNMGVIVCLTLAATVPVKGAPLLMCHSENPDFVWSDRVNQ